METTFTISGMHCAACVGRVKDALRPFADEIAVTLQPPQAILRNPKTHDIARLNAAVAKVGAYSLTAVAAPAAASLSVIENDERGWLATYFPLFLIIGYIAIAALAGTGQADGISWRVWMSNFMAGFFLVFSAFKFLDLRGFADAYATYDLLAKRWHGYGFIYPFLELGLGLAYLFRFAPTLTNAATFLLMGFSSLGVLAALRAKRSIVCACLGTVLKLPMSTITLVEDLGMAAMAALMLLAGGHN